MSDKYSWQDVMIKHFGKDWVKLKYSLVDMGEVAKDLAEAWNRRSHETCGSCKELLHCEIFGLYFDGDENCYCAKWEKKDE